MANNSKGFLLAVDIDGTLLTHDHRLLPQVREAVRHARRHGIQLALVSARSVNAVRTVLNMLGDVDHAICFGGALTMSMEGGALLMRPAAKRSHLCPADVAKVLAFARKYDLALAAYSADVARVPTPDDRMRQEFSQTQEPFEFAAVSAQDPVFKFLAISHAANADDLDRLGADLSPDLSAVRSHRTYLEIGPQGVSKGRALTDLAVDLGLDLENAVAVGDSNNDASMLRAVGHPVAMGDATTEIRQLAKLITATAAEGGVARAIDHFAKALWRIPPSRAEQEVKAGWVS
ncbi:MAG: hypothetical protein DI533_01120 [Cereibacter sphaeroides]|uniref:HAD family phosphatase n=1 Tax=Cereibacter sphaeroides TaxID=1063 RepID=A0A2W5SHS5_CERSP|nr:MAG: hypothetical protein DI533_01120 [Cereibacter sphaeroides]